MVMLNYTFLSSVAEYICQKHSGRFENVLILMPNRRSCLFLEKAFESCYSNQTVWLPAIFSFKDWINRHSSLVVVDELILIFHLYKIFQKHHSGFSFEDFYLIGKTILNDFNEIDSELVDAKLIFQNISELEELKKNFAIDEDIKQIQEKFYVFFVDKKAPAHFLEIWSILAKVYAEFSAHLIQESLAYDGLLLKYFLINELQNCKLPESIYIIGFNALTRSELEIFRYLKKCTNTTFLWDYDNLYVDDKQYNAGYFLRNLLREFPLPDDFQIHCDNLKNQHIKHFHFPNEVAQVKYLPVLLSEVSNDMLRQTAIVLINQSLLLNVLHSLPDGIEKFNITMGYPIRFTETYSFIKLLVQIYDVIHRSNSANKYIRVNDLLSLLYHPFIVHSESAKNNIDSLKKDNKLFVSIDKIESLPYSVSEFLNAEESQYFEQLLKVFYCLDAELSEYYEQSRSLQIEQQAIRKLLNSLTHLIEQIDKHQLEISSYRLKQKIFIQLAGLQKLDLIGEPLESVQIMGLMETRLLDFEKLIVLSANDDYLPEDKFENTFILYPFRKYFGLPTQSRREAIDAYHFYRLLHRSKDITICSSELVENKNSTVSPYLNQLEICAGVEVKHYTPSLTFHLTSTTGEIQISKPELGEEWTAFLQYLNDKGISRNALSDYVYCPLRFYLNYVKKLKKDNLFIEDEENKELGIIVHKVVEELLRSYEEKTLTHDILKDIKANVDDVIEKIFNNYGVLPLIRLLQKDQVKWYVATFFEKELSDKNRYPATLVGVERGISKNLQVSDNMSVRFYGQYDLLLKTQDSYHMIDFKFSSPKDNTIDSIDSVFSDDEKKYKYPFQLLFYGYLLDSDELPVYLQNVFLKKQYDDRINPWLSIKKEEGVELLDVRSVKEELNEKFKVLLNDLLNDHIPFVQTKNVENCKYCIFNVTCKKI